MPTGPIRTVAILGGGPAGACLATFLSQAGIDVALFHRAKRPPIIVGESLVPAIVPFLQRLGVEEEVASYSTLKRGATFVLNREEDLSVFFDDVRGAKTPYSYNVPRDRFDQTLLDVAARHTKIIECNARLVRDGDGDRVRLDDETLARASDVLSSQPDLIIDAGGRGRVINRLLDIDCVEGDRKDTALHAHVEGVTVAIENNIHTDRLEHGWTWRIPLPGRVSVGLVIDSKLIRSFGETPEEQFDNYLRHDAQIKEWMKPARRVTPVVRYTNYQLVSDRGVGENWALLGDSFGFVDPVFSSGLLIAMQGAEELAETILDGSTKAFDRYEASIRHKILCWQQVIEHFYDGRLLTLFQVGEVVRSSWRGKLLDFHFRKHMPRIFTGEGTTNRYSLGLVKFMARHGLLGNDPESNRIL